MCERTNMDGKCDFHKYCVQIYMCLPILKAIGIKYVCQRINIEVIIDVKTNMAAKCKTFVTVT